MIIGYMVNVYKKENRENLDSLFYGKNCAIFMISQKKKRKKISGFEQKNFCNIFEKNMKKMWEKKMKTNISSYKLSEKNEKTELEQKKLVK